MEKEKITTKKSKPELPVISFNSMEAFEHWLDDNYACQGIWLQMYKKGSGVSTIVYAEALEVALCYGWIDGQLKKLDELSYLQRFTPRRKNSNWSKRNIEIVGRLENEGRMRPSGIKEVEAAKANGRWELAYDSPSKMIVPDDFLAILSKHKIALNFFENLDKVNKYSIGYKLQTAKTPEIREKKMKEIIQMMVNGEKFH